MHTVLHIIPGLFGVEGNHIGEEGIEELRSRLIELKHGDVLDSMSDDEGEEESETEEESESEEEQVEEVAEEKIKSDEDDESKKAQDFLLQPSVESFNNLPEHNRVEIVKKYLKTNINDVASICKTFVKVSSVIYNNDDVIPCTDVLLEEAFMICDKPEIVINDLLIHMGLLKSEEKIKPACDDITGVLLTLDHATKQEYFPKSYAYFFTTFLSKPKPTIKCSPSARTKFLETLKQL